MRSLKTLSIAATLVLIAIVSTPAFAAGPYVVDGQFADWSGAQNIPDQSGDGPEGEDVNYFYWGTNPNDNTLYFMIQRYEDDSTEDGDSADYVIFIDTNNNGSYSDGVDRQVTIDYNPSNNGSSVTVKIRDSDGDSLKKSSGKWGQSTSQGALKVEAAADFQTLGIAANQTIRMFAAIEEDDGDRAPDSGDIQFAPTPILDYPLLGASLIVIAGVVWWKKGRVAWKVSL